MDILASKEKTIGLVLALVGILGLIVAGAWDILQGKTETKMGTVQLGGIGGGLVLLIVGLVVMFKMGGGEGEKREEWKEPEQPSEQPTEEQQPTDEQPQEEEKMQ